MQPVLERNCPKCGKVKNYTNKQSYKLAVQRNRSCVACTRREVMCRPEMGRKFKERYASHGANAGSENPFFGQRHTEETKRKIAGSDRSYTQTESFRTACMTAPGSAIGRRGDLNHMHGKSVEQHWNSTLSPEVVNLKIKQMKAKQSSNSSGSKNPMFGRPSPSGSGNGWSGWYKSWYFRSLRELSYVVNVLDKSGAHWKSGETIRIPYVDYDGTERTYSPDFIVNDTEVVEVKPTKLHSSPAVVRKAKAAINYCLNVGKTYSIVDSPILTDEEIHDLRQTGQLKFIERYEHKYQQRCRSKE